MEKRPQSFVRTIFQAPRGIGALKVATPTKSEGTGAWCFQLDVFEGAGFGGLTFYLGWRTTSRKPMHIDSTRGRMFLRSILPRIGVTSKLEGIPVA